MSKTEVFKQVPEPPDTVLAMQNVISSYVEVCKQRREKVLSKQVMEDRISQEKMISELQEYQPHMWLVQAASNLPKLELASHTSKQHHPDSKATCLYVRNLFYSTQDIPFIGTDIYHLEPDVKCSAAYLPIFSFFRQKVGNISVLNLVLEKNPAFFQAIQNICGADGDHVWGSLLKFVEPPNRLNAGRTAKQVFFPTTKQYHLLVVLYPTSLVHQAWQQIDGHLFTKKDEQVGLERHLYPNLLVQRYGGANPQGISMLNVNRGGSMWLLPSLPPTWSSQSLSLPKSGFFGNYLTFHPQMKPALAHLIHWYKKAYQPNNLPFREERDRRLAAVVDAVLDVALSIQSQAPCGWAQDSSLSAAQKIWLDRQYLAPLEQVDTPEQQALLDLMHREEWQQQIAKDFGGWLNVQLRSVIDDLDDAEKRVWAVYYFADTLNAMWGDAA